MRRYTRGDSGDAVRDIQDRLDAIGYPWTPDHHGEFGSGTSEAVTAFQSSHGLDPNGEIDDHSWQILVDAGYRLGDRVLYHRRPMIRGGDVAELQQLLNDLGFDADRADGIFGPLTARAVLEFQANRGLGEDGIAGPGVIAELVAVQRSSRKIGKEALREREWLRSLPPTLVSSRACFDAACRTPDETAIAWQASSFAASAFRDLGGVSFMSRSASVPASEDVRSRRANRLGSDLVLSFQLPRSDRPGVFYFDSGRTSSLAGQMLANYVTVTTGLESGGRSFSILRGTRAPAIVISAPRLDAELAHAVIRGVVDFFGQTAAGMESG
jgi:N-acetylmuramoyl-L-alanine amidase